MKSLIFSSLLLVLLGTFCVQFPAHAQFLSGDLLVSEFGANAVEQYRPDGTLVRTFTGTGSVWKGAALTPEGNLVTTYQYLNGNNTGASGINIFNASGTQIASFSTPNVTVPEDVSVFADGTLAIDDFSSTSPAVRLYDQQGHFLRNLIPGGLYSPFGNTVDAANTLWVADTGGKFVWQLSQTGAVLNGFNTGLNVSPIEIVVAPDGTLYVADNGTFLVDHLSSTGATLGSFSVGGINIRGLALAPDGQSLYVTGIGNRLLYHYDLNGNRLGTFPLNNPNNAWFLTVVPNAAPLAVPEPDSFALLALSLVGASVLALRRGHARKANTSRVA